MTETPTPAGASWTKSAIEDLLRRESFKYQSVPLPHGLRTEGHDRAGTADLIFPDDLSGQSVMDVGSALGFFCFDARRRGADRVLGVDLEAENVRKARILAEVLSETVEFERRDIEHKPVEESFDHVLCLNVLHHLVDPILGLDRLIAVARRRLVLEVATFGAHDRRKLRMSRVEQMVLDRLPVVLVGSGASSEGIKQFYFTRHAMDHLLRFRRGCFASVETFPSDFKGRFIVVGHKHRIGNLLVTSGPVPSIVMDLTRRFQRGELTALEQGLPHLAAGSWDSRLAAESYHEEQATEHERLIYEYDFLRPFARGAQTFERDPAAEVIDMAEKVTFATYWIPPDELTPVLESGREKAKGRELKRLGRVIEECGDPRRLVERYREWFEYSRGQSADHVVVSTRDGSPVFMTPAEWETEIAGPLLS